MEGTSVAANERGSAESSQLDSTSGPNRGSNAHEFTQKALECPLCLSLICEPLSISCGHSFCRVCLVKSLRRSKKKCPQCRAVCHVSAEDAQENFMIKELAMSSNPNEYAARLLEAEAEKSSWMTLLPIFYYNETLFPGGRLDLHLFEPRYRVMMQRVVNSTRSFAYVANFNQYRAHVGDVALIAVLEEVEFMADGRCMLQAKLSSRMIIADHYVEEGTQGLHFCRLTPLMDNPMEEAQIPVVAQLVNLATLIIGSLFSGSIRALEERYGPAPPPNLGAAGAEAFSLWMAAVCPLSDYEKARLLKTTDTAERLRAAVGCFSTVMSRVPSAGTNTSVAGGGMIHNQDIGTDNNDGDNGNDDNNNMNENVHDDDDDEEEEEIRPPRRRRARRQPLRRPVQVMLNDALQAVRRLDEALQTATPVSVRTSTSTFASAENLTDSALPVGVQDGEEMVTEEENDDDDDDDEDDGEEEEEEDVEVAVVVANA